MYKIPLKTVFMIITGNILIGLCRKYKTAFRFLCLIRVISPEKETRAAYIKSRKDEITRMLNAELTVDTRLVTSIAEAMAKGDADKISAAEDINKIIDGAKEIKDELKKAYKKIFASSKSAEEFLIKARALKNIYEKTESFNLTGDAETDAKIRERLINEEEILKFASATENLEAVENYISENKLSKKEAEKLRSLALEEGKFTDRGSDGKLRIYGCGKEGKEETYLGDGKRADRRQVFKEMQNGVVCAQKYKRIMMKAKESITEILLNESAVLRKMPGDSESLLPDTLKVMKNLCCGLETKETYVRAFLKIFASSSGFCCLGNIACIGI